MAAPHSVDPLAALPPVTGYRRRVVRPLLRAADRILDARQKLSGLDRALAEAAEETGVQSILVLGVYGPQRAGAAARIATELRGSRHAVRIAFGSLGAAVADLEDVTEIEHMEGGKLANANRLAGAAGIGDADWVLLIDDDIELGAGFLDRLLVLADNFQLDLVQPALTLASHTAFSVTRRRPLALRRTRFVEVGPAVLMRRGAFDSLTPFSEEGMGWGICLTWAAEAARRRWRLGVADAVAVRHESRPAGAGYNVDEARAAARTLLEARPHITWQEAGEVLERHRGPGK